MKSCIYEIKIGQYYYIGKDTLNKRKREHLNLLLKNRHYNSFMQNVFNKYQNFNFSIEEHFEESIVSSGRQKLSYERSLDILNLKNNGLNNSEIGREMDMDTSAISRLVNKKTYSTYWEKYLKCV